jgi:D-alanyl-D-alanine carboxypeptidase
MKKIICFIFLSSLLQSAAFPQTPYPDFLNSNLLRAPVEPMVFFPLCFSGGNGPASLDTTVPAKIIAAMNATYARQRLYARHGIVVSVHIPGRPDWSGAVGLNFDSVAMDPSLGYEIASITKTFVTALIMRLQAQGKLSIKDSIGKYITKKYPNIDGAITIEQLLNHSSGIFDYMNDDRTLAAIQDFYALNPSFRWTPDSILLAFVGPPNFAAGTSYRYSNTNFVLAGMIAEIVGRTKLGQQIHQNFIAPLKLTHTFFGGDDSIPLTFAHNWVPPYTGSPLSDTTSPESDFYYVDKTAQLTGTWGAANMVSTPGDILRWGNLLYTGQVLDTSSLAQMMAMHAWPFFGIFYGLGTQRIYGGNKFLYGHSGSLMGFKSAMWTNPKDSVTVSLYMNSDAIYRDAGVNDYINDVFSQIYPSFQSVDESNASVPVSVVIYPNPSSDHATFYFRTSTDSRVKLVLCDGLGRSLGTLIDEMDSPGVHSVTCDLSRFRSGTYFYRMQAGAEVGSGKLVIE